LLLSFFLVFPSFNVYRRIRAAHMVLVLLAAGIRLPARHGRGLMLLLPRDRKGATEWLEGREGLPRRWRS